MPRLLIAFFNTDEIFALAMAEKQPLTVSFLLGLGLTPILGWTAGTLCGALAGSVLPLGIRTALGVMLYGMFIAIVIPPAKREKNTAMCVILSIILSCIFYYVPFLKSVPSGFVIIICATVASGIFAFFAPLSPISQKEETEDRVNG